MSKIREFFENLKKSTKITLISCGSFVLMTFIILCFFIMSPITPADKAGSTFGRESVSVDGSTVTGIVTTVDENGNTIEVSKGTTNLASTTARVTTTHKEYEIKITTGTGYYSEGKISIGNYDGYSENSYTTTSNSGYSSSQVTTTAAGSSDDPDVTDNGSDEPATTADNGDGPGEEPTLATEAPTEPIVTEPPTQAPEPTEPVTVPTLPPSPPDNGGESAGGETAG